MASFTCALKNGATLAAWLLLFGSTVGVLAQGVPGSTAPDFGPNVLIFDPSMDAATIQAKCDQIYSQEETAEFGSQRYALFFKPGAYNATVKVGFYTQVYGLGKSPDDTTITGAVTADARWNNGNATDNFWRGMENLAIVPTAPNGDMWAVSQAAPVRRVHIKGDCWLFDNGWSSGGFMADTKVDGYILPGSQQQWLSRNSQWTTWKNGVWNMVFVGDIGAPTDTWPVQPYTTIDKTPIIREKPYLYLDGSTYNVFVPATITDSQGPSWTNGNTTPGTSLPLSQFYIAHAGKDTSATINAALAKGSNLLLTPGIYQLDDSIKVTRADTVILGLGMPTLTPQKGNPAMEIADVNGVRLACVLFEAGTVSSPLLLQVGPEGSRQSHASDPTVLSDIFCRVGGARAGAAKVCVEINSNDVIGDHAWIWRADHGAGAGWTSNPSLNGLIVNGANVTYYGLFVEHFQEDQVVWNGENGRDYFFQSEMPYDPPAQNLWQHGNVKGWPAFKVSDKVSTFNAWGLGIYCIFNNDNIFADTAIEAPNTPGVKFHDALTFRLSGATDNSGINSVINGTGSPSTKASTKSEVIDYPAP
jgi:hypothetical protein